jgi:hypothetical protein
MRRTTAIMLPDFRDEVILALDSRLQGATQHECVG